MKTTRTQLEVGPGHGTNPRKDSVEIAAVAQSPAPTRRKIVFLGSHGCGQTSIITRLAQDYFPVAGTWTNSRYFGFVKLKVQVKGDTVKLRMCEGGTPPEPHDLSGVRFRPMILEGANVAVLLYSIESPESLEEVVQTRLIPEVRQHLGPIITVLLGCKMDLREDHSEQLRLAESGRRMLRWDDGEAIRKQIGADLFFECSAKEDSTESLQNISVELARLSLLYPYRIREKRGKLCNIM
ncbi:P-loop containing nucleoside triphosphate hydrolase protein [Meredithblackwellia eburnea MCA 4105]